MGLKMKKFFSEHQAVAGEDGTYSILAVPVFELGEHKGFDYSKSWAQEAISKFLELKEKNRLPRLILGHTEPGYEKKAVGFLDNLQLKGKQIIADLVKIKEEIFNEIKDMEWPGRSAEVNPEKKKFTALALLGGSEPYFENLEPIEVVFKGNEGGVWVPFGGDLETVIEGRDKEQKLSDIWWTGRDLIDAALRSDNLEGEEKKSRAKDLLEEMIKLIMINGEAYINQIAEGAQTMGKVFTEEEHAAILEAVKKGFRQEYIQNFKAEHGVSPEEALARFKEKEVAVKKLVDNVRQRAISSFCETLKNQGLAPAIVDAYQAVRPRLNDSEKVVKFADTDEDLTVGAYMDRVFETLTGYAREGRLVIKDGETGPKNIDGNNDKPDEAKKRQYYREHKKLFAKTGTSENDFVEFGEI